MRQKPLEFANAMHPSDGKFVGFIRVRVDEQTVKNIGKFEVQEADWENFKLLMESVAEFYWSFN